MDLLVPQGTPLRIAIDRRARIKSVGEPVHGKVMDDVYAFDRVVIPAGSEVRGSITRIEPIPARVRVISYADGRLTPFHRFEVAFDQLTFPDGSRRDIHTQVSRGTQEVVHLVADSPGNKEKKQNALTGAAKEAAQEAKSKVHVAAAEIKAPGRMHRLKEFLLAQSPYRRQYLQPGTRFNATLEAPLDFGDETLTREQLSEVGQLPAQDSVLDARLAAEVSSADAKAGDPISAVLSKPVYSADHHLLLPADTRFLGQVVKARPARKLHHNGQLRVSFDRLETPAGLSQPMDGGLAGVEVDRAANLRLDDEGGARATDHKTRYLTTGFSLLMAAAASHPDTEHGTTDAAGDGNVRAGAGLSGYGISGSLITLAARSQPVSIAFAAYGASMSVYTNFLSRGRDVVFPANTPMEIGFGRAHRGEAGASQPKSTH